MKEFGSDFHLCDDMPQLRGKAPERWRAGGFYADGRQAICDLIRHRGWLRIWIPGYFCYEIVRTIAGTGIAVAFYDDGPEADDTAAVAKLPFRAGDVLLRMNFFGLRDCRDNAALPVEVIEDHSHALSGPWVEGSNADWCFASLRKTLPLSEGGVLWSPRGHELPAPPPQTTENRSLAERRLRAMRLKSDYLAGREVDKELFRGLYIATEEELDTLPLSALDPDDEKMLSTLDVGAWNERKRRNWQQLCDALAGQVEILQPETQACIPFSLVIRGQKLKARLVAESIYPALLWEVPAQYDRNLLSIHCDGRYGPHDMENLTNKIRSCLK